MYRTTVAMSRLGGVLGLVGAEAGDAALEAGVDDCRRKPAGPLNTTASSPSAHQVLGHDQLVHAVAVEVHRERGGLDLEELAAVGLRADIEAPTSSTVM